jgi:hypothetical protein
MNTSKTFLMAGIAMAGIFSSMAEDQAAGANINAAVLTSKESQTAYPALSDDLINVNSPALVKVTHDGFKQHESFATAALNNGKNDEITFDLDGKWSTTFELDITKAPKGYTISEIITSAGWAPNRACQKYELLVSKVSAPDKFISLGVFEADAANTLATQLKLTGKDNVIATNVAAVKFNFLILASSVGGACETTYREIDIIGTPSDK